MPDHKTDRIVRPDRTPEVDEVWMTRDGSKVMVYERVANRLRCRVLRGTVASPAAQLTYDDAGRFNYETGGKHELDLVTYITTI